MISAALLFFTPGHVMRRYVAGVLVSLAMAIAWGCGGGTSNSTPGIPLTQARQGFVTKILCTEYERTPIAQPPASHFQLVSYESPVGPLGAYLSPEPSDGKKHPVIIWITGGECNTIGDVWSNQVPSSDQSASDYRAAGILMMFPSLRGGNDNPGVIEGFYGEVDDVIAAANYLSKLDYVDPTRIYLGGHSTGGTLALLVAESSTQFRAVFAFGPADEVKWYDPEYLPYDTSNRREEELRSPIHWLATISTPTFVIEGTEGNIVSLNALASESSNNKLTCIEVARRDHFNVLGHSNRLIAQKILADTGPTCNISLTVDELRFLN